MDKHKAKEIVDFIFKDIFGRDNLFSLEEIKKKFAFDIPLPKKIKCSLTDKDTWSFSAEGDKVVSLEGVTERFKKDEWMEGKKSIASMADILKAWGKINYITGDKQISSVDVIESDSVNNSSMVYQGVSIYQSKNVVCSYNSFDSNYLFASRDNNACTLGIRLKESIYCTSCFEVSWSNKVSRSMYVHDSLDLYECLFCSHLRSKKYCIANMQFEKEEYFRIKKMVIEWILK